jgi:hypothetical protein
MSTLTVPTDAAGQAVAGYTTRRELGRGSSGRVVEAADDESGRLVAIKLLAPDLVGDPAFVSGLRAAAGTLRELSVPQVVQVYEFAEQDRGAAVVMELVAGVSLHDLIERCGPLGPRAALTVLKDALLGLAAAHARGIVHGDLKPENVLIDPEGNSKLTDFGIAVRWGKQAPAAGTPLYLAPERWQGAPAGPAADFYAATAVCYECLDGRTPFSGGLQELREQHVDGTVPVGRIDPPLQHLIARGMARDPAGRPQSAIAFVSELEAAALAAYGPGWEDLGRAQLAMRATELLSLLPAGGGARSASRSYTPSPAGSGSGSAGRGSGSAGGGRKRPVLAAALAAVVLIGGAAAIALQARDHHAARAAGTAPPATAPAARPAPARPRTPPPATPATSRPMTPTPMRPVPAPAASAGMPALMAGAGHAPPSASLLPAMMTFVSDFSATATLGTPVDLGGSVQGARGPLHWTVTGLAPGLTTTPGNHGSTLVITGTPTRAGTFAFTVTVTDSGPAPSTLTGTFSLTVSPQPWGISTTALPSGTAGTAYTATLASTGSVTVTWSATGLPAGLSLDPATGTISGTPQAAAAATVYVTATVAQAGAGATTKTAAYDLTVSAAPPPSAPPAPSATAGQ